MLSVGYNIPGKNILVSSGEAKSKVDLLEACHMLHDNGYNIYSTSGTAAFLNDNGIKAIPVAWPDEEGELQIMEMLNKKQMNI